MRLASDLPFLLAVLGLLVWSLPSSSSLSLSSSSSSLPPSPPPLPQPVRALNLPVLSSIDAPVAAHVRLVFSRNTTTIDFVHIHKCYGTNFLFTMIPYLCPERKAWNDTKANGIASENCLFYANYSSIDIDELTNGYRFHFISDERPIYEHELFDGERGESVLDNSINWHVENALPYKLPASVRAWTTSTVKAIFFRDPIDRAVSDFEYLIWHDQRFSKSEPISHILEEPYAEALHDHVPAFYFHNHQSRMALGNGFGNAVLKDILKKLGEMHSGPCLDADEKAALRQHLWKFHFIGIAAQPGVSNCLFAWTIGHQEMIDDFCEPVLLQTVVTQENARNESWFPLHYSTRDYANIVRANRCDLELYTIAQEIFYERVGQLL